MRSLFLLLLLIPATVAAQEIGPYGYGFRGDGTGVYPGCRPPTRWDDTTNVAWKAKLPNWGYSCPVPVPGKGVVLMMTEPFPPDYWPQLNCFDAKTGERLWKVPVDPLDAFPGLSRRQREAIIADVKWIHDGLAATYRVCRVLYGKGYVPKGDPLMDEINADLQAYGVAVESYKKGYGLLRKLRYLDRNRPKQIRRRLKPYGIAATTTWQNFGGARVGTCFPTPVTDGESVFVMTRHGTVACFDLEGRLRWARSAGYKGHHGLMASPRLYEGILLTGWIDTGNFDPRLMAWDARTGRLLWEADVRGGTCLEGYGSRPGGALVCMTVGETPVVLCSSGRVVRLPDGKVYDAPIPKSCGTYAVDDGGDIVFGGGHHDRGSFRWGLALRKDGTGLAVAPVYVGGRKSAYGPISGVYVDGRLFVNYAQLDPESGKPLGASDDVADLRRKAKRSGPQSRHLLLAAGGHVYGLREVKPRKGQKGPVKGVCEVYSYDGRKVAENALGAGPWDEEAEARWLQQGFGKSGFSYSCSMNIAGDSIYICSKDFLYRIGN